MTNQHANLFIEEANAEVRRGRIPFAIRWLEQVKRQSRDLVMKAELDQRIDKLKSVQEATL